VSFQKAGVETLNHSLVATGIVPVIDD